MLKEIQSDWPLVYILNETYVSEFYLLGVRTILSELCSYDQGQHFRFFVKALTFMR